MQYNRDDILKDLRHTVLEVTFTKVNGENRVMRCTLDPVRMPQSYLEEVNQEKEFHSKNENVIAAWDVQKGGWRSFRIDSVLYVQDVGENY